MQKFSELGGGGLVEVGVQAIYARFPCRHEKLSLGVV